MLNVLAACGEAHEPGVIDAQPAMGRAGDEPRSGAPASPAAPPSSVTAAPTDLSPSGFALAVDPARSVVRQGESVAIHVSVTRAPDAPATPVTIELASPSAGLSAASVMVPPGAARGDLIVLASSAAAQGVTTLDLRGRAPDTSADAKVALVVAGPAGTLDTSFASGGKRVGVFGPDANAFATDLFLQPDGKILLVGSCAAVHATCLARLDERGALDNTFGTGGTVIRPEFSGASAAAFQPDGKIVLGHPQGHLSRLMPDGTLDASFGAGGVVALSPPTNGGAAVYPDRPRQIAIAKDGSVLTYFEVIGTSSAVASLTPTGAMAASFGTGGFTYLQVLPVAGAFGLRTDGRPVGFGWNGGDTQFFELTIAGARDTSFGSPGSPYYPGQYAIASTQWSVHPTMVRGLFERPNGNLVVARNDLTTASFGLVGANASGTDVDAGLGGGSGASPLYPGRASYLTPAANGRLLVAGSTQSSAAGQAQLTRLEADGTLDTTFAGGQPIFGSGAVSSAVNAVATAEGRILLIGNQKATTDGSSDVFVARVWE